MRRRDTLRRCAAVGAAVSLGLLAGCAGAREESATESAALSVKTFDVHESESGELVVTVTVANSGKSAATGHLYVTVTAAEATTETATNGTAESSESGGTVATRESLEVTVPAGETKAVEIPFDFTMSQFERDGSIDVSLRS